ncbi:MAG TPA: NAD(P)-binding domain-containing protein, partial [Sphingomicrobium sp.]|nr:NAD(P)-binding domain-containing protein [Sphingomicrobium sp.]
MGSSGPRTRRKAWLRSWRSGRGIGRGGRRPCFVIPRSAATKQSSGARLDCFAPLATTRSLELAKIAFIGLGHMGGGMAPNLAKAGHAVLAFDLVSEAVDKAVAAGCSAAASAADA